MITGLIRAIEQLGDPRMGRLILLSLGASVVMLVLLVAGVSLALHFLKLIDIHWLDTLVSWLLGIGATVLAFLLFPAVVGIVISLFLDDVAQIVEDRYYPGLPRAPGQSLLAGLWTGVRFAGVLIGVNVLLLIVYLVMLATVVLAPFVPVVFYVVNGWLCGREYFEQVAFRRYDDAEARELRRPYGVQLTMVGALIAFLAMIPIVNLIAPLVATAYMVHVVQDFARRRAAATAARR